MPSDELSCDLPLVLEKYVPICYKNGTDLSICTISRSLSKEFGLKSYKPVAKPGIISAMKKKKLSFVNKYLH